MKLFGFSDQKSVLGEGPLLDCSQHYLSQGSLSLPSTSMGTEKNKDVHAGKCHLTVALVEEHWVAKSSRHHTHPSNTRDTKVGVLTVLPRTALPL